MRLLIYLSVFAILHNAFAIPIPSGPSQQSVQAGGSAPPPGNGGTPKKRKWIREPSLCHCIIDVSSAQR